MNWFGVIFSYNNVSFGLKHFQYFSIKWNKPHHVQCKMFDGLWQLECLALCLTSINKLLLYLIYFYDTTQRVAQHLFWSDPRGKKAISLSEAWLVFNVLKAKTTQGRHFTLPSYYLFLLLYTLYISKAGWRSRTSGEIFFFSASFNRSKDALHNGALWLHTAAHRIFSWTPTIVSSSTIHRSNICKFSEDDFSRLQDVFFGVAVNLGQLSQ